MFSNKGNINKNSSGNNHIAGDNNIIKNESNDTINNTNNYYGISWKFITRILPSPKHTNKRNVAIGWLYLGLLIFTNIFRTFWPIESSPHPSNLSSTSQTPTAVLSPSTTSSSPSISATYSASSLPSVQTVSPLPSNSLSSKTQDSPTPATRPEGSPPGRISIEFSDTPSTGEKIGRDKYQISSSGHVGLRVGWSSISYNNTVSSNDCEIVLTSSGPAPVKGGVGTAKCTDTYGTSLEFSEPGEYTISVEDKQSGNTGSRVIQIVK